VPSRGQLARFLSAITPRREKVYSTRADAARASGDTRSNSAQVEIHVVLVMQLVFDGTLHPSGGTARGDGINVARVRGERRARIMTDDS